MKPTYITTSIAYINAEPHIGFLFELLAADVLKRYHQSLGEEVFLLTGTDEHGIKVAKSAQDAGLEPQPFADELSTKFKDLGKQFNIDFDYFIRTTNSEHIEFVQEKWGDLADAGVLEKKTYSGLYCSGCEAFKTDSEIEEGKCVIHDSTLEKVDEENWFLNISADQKQTIKAWIKKSVFPVTRRQEVINILDSGAYDQVSVSRPKSKNSWGIEVPGDHEQVMYVWVDALFNYISGIISSGHKIEELWPADYQYIGKDILKFHAIIWPALLLVCGYELPKRLLVHGFINVEGKKMSKSLGNVITPTQLKERYGADAVRYLLHRQFSFFEDSNFVWEDFDRIYNGELANGLGNLLARVVGLVKRSKLEVADAVIERNIKRKELAVSLELESANTLVNEADELITANQLWVDSDSKREVLVEVVNKLQHIATILTPFMPDTATEIRRQLTELDSKPLFPRL